MLTKLIYLYEEVEKEMPKTKRHRLVNPHYLCSINMRKGNEAFLEDVNEYLDCRYDLKNKKLI